MEKLDIKDTQTLNIIDENIKQLKEIFPEVFREDKVDFDRLQELLGNYVNDSEENYNFTWHGKRRAARLAQTPSTGTLRPCKEESVDFDKTQNLFIEGDNLEVLKLLQKSYHRKVKMIYIDPPYNTGNDFVYEDDFKDGVKHYLELTKQVDSEGKKLGTNSSSAGRYHTNWLNMMYPRLKLARNLLREDGVIFISIDDNEQANLKKLCDEVFGEENFIATFKWNKTSKAPTLSKAVRNKYEYLLCFSKFGSKEFKGKDSYNTMAPLFNSSNNKKNVKFPANSIECLFDDGIYKKGLYGSGDKEVELVDDLIVLNGMNNNECTISAKFKWSQETVIQRFSHGQKFAFKKPNFTTMYYYLDNGVEGQQKYIAPSDIINMEECGVERNDEGYSELRNLFAGVSVFDYTKPSSLISYLSKMIVDDNFLILDFFAGSGTSAHAVMKLNAEDGGNRRHISVQLPEITDEKSEAFKAGYKNIAEIAKERIRRAAKKIKEENPDYKGDLGFKVFKLDTSNIKTWEAGFDSLKEDLFNAVDYIKQDRSKEDILYELLLKYGLDLTVPIEAKNIAGKAVYSVGLGALIVCLESDISADVVNGIVELKEQLRPEVTRVVFKDSSFKDDVVKTNALQILKRAGIEDVKSL